MRATSPRASPRSRRARRCPRGRCGVSSASGMTRRRIAGGSPRSVATRRTCWHPAAESPMKKTFRHVNDLWDDAKAASLGPVERLVYRSNLLRSDQRITNTGGGNTSSKLPGKDPLSGKPVDVLWVKGSGGDLRTSTRANFSSLYQDRLGALRDAYKARA